jgi:HSP20 family molecular chaperone IbpA
MYNLSFSNRGASIFDLIDRPFDFMSDYESRKYSTESTDREYKIKVSLPGHDKESVKVSVEGGKLSICAKAENESANPLCKSESFRFVLPKNCKPDEIDAQLVNGILTVSIAKILEKRQDKRVEISVN